MFNELKRCEERNRYLETQMEEMRYKGSTNVDAEQQLFELENRLREREEDMEEMQTISDKNEREYLAANSRLQKALEEQESKHKRIAEDFRVNEMELREQIEEYERRERSNERELESIKVEAGYFHTEIRELKGQLEELEAINEELRREVNREQSEMSDSSAFGDLKAHISNLNSEVETLRQFNLTKDTNELLAENQMLQRQVFAVNARNSVVEKENAELRVHVQEGARKLESLRNKHDTLAQSHAELESNHSKREQRMLKIERDNELMKEKILHPELRRAIADVEVAEDIDIGELKVKVRNCILILELFLNDPSEPLAPKQIEVEELHNIKTLLIEIDMKVKSLVEENKAMRKSLGENQEIVDELEDINARLGSQSKGYEQLIRKLEEEFERSITRNERIELNYAQEVQQQLGYMREQSGVEVSHLRQELETRVLEYEVKISSIRNACRRSEISLHNAYQQKQEELASKLRELEKAHQECIRQLRVLGPEKEETIARLYSSIHDLELELKLYKSRNDLAEKDICGLAEAVRIKEEANEVLQNNIKVILSSQGENIEQLENCKLREKDHSIRNEGLSREVSVMAEKIRVLEAANIELEAEVRIAQEEAAEFYHRSQNVGNELNARILEHQAAKEQGLNEVSALKQRLQQSVKEKQELEEVKARQEKYHDSELTVFRKNQQQKLEMVERVSQESARQARLLQEKVDNLTLINIQLLGELKRHESHGFNAVMESSPNQVQTSFYMGTNATHSRFAGM